METMTLNDGTVLKSSYAYEVNGKLYLYIRAGMDIVQVFNLLADPEKTAVIECDRYGAKATYEGYEAITCVSDEGDGMITASLRKV